MAPTYAIVHLNFLFLKMNRIGAVSGMVSATMGLGC